MSHSTTSGGCALVGRAALERDDVGAAAERRAHRGAHVDEPPARIGDKTPRPDLRDREAQARDQPLRLRELLLGHGLEVGALQHFALGHRERRVELDLLRRVLGLGARFLLRQERLGEPAREIGLLVGRPPDDLRQEEPHHALEHLRVAPEDVERLVEELELLAPVEEDGGERPVEVVAPLDARDLERFQRVDDLVGPDREAGTAQDAREVHDVLGELAGAAGARDVDLGHGARLSHRPLGATGWLMRQ